MVYDRAHTRDLLELNGISAAVPRYAAFLMFCAFAGLGLPGLNGFVGEFLIFRGAFPLATWATALSTFGLLITAIFILTLIQKVFWGPLNERWSSFVRASFLSRRRDGNPALRPA